MPETVNWNFSVQVVNGPAIASTGIIKVEAYDKINIAIGAATGAGPTIQTVNLQPPAAAASGAQLLAIRSSLYVDPVNPALTVSYQINGAGTATNLTAPIVLIGAAAISLMDANLTSLAFSNPTSEEIKVEILIGRDATP